MIAAIVVKSLLKPKRLLLDFFVLSMPEMKEIAQI